MIRHIPLLGLLVVAFACADSAYASDDKEIKALILDLKTEVRMLREEVRMLSRKIDGGRSGRHGDHFKWGCYINDIKAGGISGVGSTKAEAIGKVLEECTAKKGACFESNIKCSSE